MRCTIKYILASLVLLNACVVVSRAQEGWFRTYDLGFTVDASADVLFFGESIFFITFSQGQDTATRNEVICMEPSGEIRWRKFLRYPEEAAAGPILFSPKGTVIAKDSSIYVYTESLVQGERVQCVVNKFSFFGELLWMRQYGEDNLDVFPSRYGICLEEDSMSIAICGVSGYWSGNENLIVYRLSPSGDIRQKRVIGTSESRIAARTPIISLSSDVLLLAYSNRAVFDHSLRNYFLHSIDTQQFTETPFSWPEESIDLARLPNGNIAYVSREPAIDTGGMHVSVFSPLMDRIWSYIYSDFEFPYPFLGNSTPLNLSVSKDGRILATGYTGKRADILCFESTGNLKWVRKIVMEGFANVLFASSSWTSDGGIVINGSLDHIGDSCEFQPCPDVFLIKLDSMGCLTQDCEQTTIISSTTGSPSLSTDFQVFPNPVISHMQLTYTGKNFLDLINAPILIYDIHGRLIHSSQMKDSTMAFDLQHLHPGLFYLLIQKGTDTVAIPFIKQ